MLLTKAAKNFQCENETISASELLGSWMIEKLEKKFNENNEDRLASAIIECVRYLILVANSDRPIFFPGSQLVDDIWHALVIETQYYRDLCNRIKPGGFIEHSGIKYSDYTKSNSAEAIWEEQLSWLASYVQTFGEITIEAYSELMLAQEIAERIDGNLESVNKLADALVKISTAANIENQEGSLTLANFAESNIRPVAHLIEYNAEINRKLIKNLVKFLRSRNPESPLELAAEELDLLFSYSACLAFTFWQNLAVVERIQGSYEWSAENPQLAEKLKKGEIFCGLATTHLAKAGKPVLFGVQREAGFDLQGTIPWFTGVGLFEKLLVGFETESEYIFAIVESETLKDSSNCKLKYHKLSAFNGTASVAIELNNFFISNQIVLSRRNKSSAPAPRPSKYIIPEIGIAKGAIRCVNEWLDKSKNPRADAVRESAQKIQNQINEILAIRGKTTDHISLSLLRDEINYNAVRLLGLALGGSALASPSDLIRFRKELILTDIVVQTAEQLNRKIFNTAILINPLPKMPIGES